MKLSEGEPLTALGKMLSDYQVQKFKVHTYCMSLWRRLFSSCVKGEPLSYKHPQQLQKGSEGIISFSTGDTMILLHTELQLISQHISEVLEL